MSCDTCYTLCGTCSEPNEKFACTSCGVLDTTQFYLRDSGECSPICPSGFTADDETARCERTMDVAACRTFNYKSALEFVDERGIAWELPEDKIPIFVFKRGIWYDGECWMALTGYILNDTFTYHIWARIQSV